ncbi:hypothetical protein LJC35_07175 [Parabacteroides sp. OttesenSCG-928-N08]|nr:hypothetical protein [Parabacteroides sp. OttesenSCG-928-N08]
MNQQMVHAGNDDNNATIYLKTPGNPSTRYPLVFEEIGDGLQYAAPKSGNIPVRITYQTEEINGHVRIKVLLTATEDIYFHLEQEIETPFRHDECQFYLPGFWYRHNLRSPQEAPSFHTSDSWLIREDRLSAPLTGIYNEKTGDYYTVARIDDFSHEALTTHKEGEIILSGRSSIGYSGFLNKEGKATLAFGFPFHEAPKTYIRKLTLSPEVMAFHHLPKNESMELVWEMVKDNGKDFSAFVEKVWNYSYDLYRPQAVTTPYTPQIMKETMTNFVTDSYVDKQELPYLSGVHLRTDDCISSGIAEIGFVGRVLLNSFNALEYGEQQGRKALVDITQNIFSGYLQHGFNAGGFFREVVNYDNQTEERNLSIRRQSEGLYAVLYYLQYEKSKGRKHPEWEQKVKQMLDIILTLQNEDGSFPRKFKEDLTIVDATGGSTPSATPMLVLSSIYFKDKRYLESAKRTANYLEKEIISKADYFSSTLDANCEDKEASYYATTALYHLALVSKGAEQQRFSDLAKRSAYFCLSWYYLWDVPFAQGQMLGDVGLKTRGWGNVSVENNHIDVYIFDFATILHWLAESYDEPRFADFAQVIQTSMCQLLPHDNHLCGVGKTGYYPEVVQHTNWDYGKNGKGFYNDIFAPGWTVASLWEMLTPERIRLFVK